MSVETYREQLRNYYDVVYGCNIGEGIVEYELAKFLSYQLHPNDYFPHEWIEDPEDPKMRYLLAEVADVLEDAEDDDAADAKAYTYELLAEYPTPLDEVYANPLTQHEVLFGSAVAYGFDSSEFLGWYRKWRAARTA